MTKGPAELFERQYGEGGLSYAQDFPRLRRLLGPWLRDRFDVTRDAVAELCAGRRAQRVLDFGCGDGRLARLVAALGSDAVDEVVGIDVSPSRIARAQSLTSPQPAGGTRLRFVTGDEAALPAVRSEGFDVILCIAVFGQIYDLYALGQTLFEALKPGGHLVAEFANYAYVRHRLRLLRGRVPTVSPAPMAAWPSIGWDSGELHHFSRRTSVRFLEQLGFAVQAVRPTGLLANLVRVWASLLATGFVIVARRPA